MKKYYLVRLGRGGQNVDDCLQGGYIGVDFGIPMNLSDHLPDDKKAFNKAFVPIMMDLLPEKTKVGAGLSCSFLYTICKELKPGDFVFCPDGKGIYYIGEIIGDYFYAAESRLPHRRPVKWTGKTIRRSDMSIKLRNVTGYFGTCCDISAYANEIVRLIATSNEMDPFEVIEMSPFYDELECFDICLSDPVADVIENTEPLLADNVPLALPHSQSVSSELCSHNFGFSRTIHMERPRNLFKEQSVYAALYAPASTKAQKWFKIQVHIYNESDAQLSNQKAKELDKNAVVMDYNPLSLQIELGTQVKAELTMYDPGVQIQHSTHILTWNGKLTSAVFMAKITDASLESIAGEVMLSVNNVPVGILSFNVDVVIQSVVDEILNPGTAKAFKKPFISYSHKDAKTASVIANAYRALGIDCFFDRYSLESGDVFDEKIEQSIEESDLFLLLWSQNAAESDYVEKEYLHALQYAYPQLDKETATLWFKPFCIKPIADPPRRLKEIYNFSTINTD